ncbi:MAG: GTP-binding protein [Prochloron sp. SP5CPC1]|nr:GTP-binding protein [Candidatus Paraprochloron terpiosi SP5CPC1]
MAIIDRKICLVGDFAVGKTSLIRRFVENKFSDEYLTTVGVKISRKMVQLAPEIDVRLLIWDLERQTKFNRIVPSYLKGAKGAIMVGDLTRPETIDHLESHIKLFLGINQKGGILLALNKSDLVSDIKREKVMEMTQFPDYPQVLRTYVTSAKTGAYVDEMLVKLANTVMKTDKRQQTRNNQ